MYVVIPPAKGTQNKPALKPNEVRLRTHKRPRGPGYFIELQAVAELIQNGIVEEDEDTGLATVTMDALGAVELAWREG